MLGGSRSGKSAFAESLLDGAGEVTYVATALPRPDDPEWAARVAAHQVRRPPTWRTQETLDIAAVLYNSGGPVLVDSITLWVAATSDTQRMDELLAAWQGTTRDVVAVSDEVGSGVVPVSAEGRRFRDALGLVNQRLAAAADDVHLVVAGLPLRLK